MRRFFLMLAVLLCVPLALPAQECDSVAAVVADTIVADTVGVVRVDTVAQQPKMNIVQRFKQRISDKLNEPFDTTRDKRYWWRAMKHGKVNFNDTTMGYPRFLLFCWKTYKWGDRAFNSYDPEYVQGTGKNWKLILKSDNWVDSYIGRPFDDVKMVVNSNLVSNIGLSLSFMAVSVGYSISISNLIHGGKVSNKFDFSFTCARFTADLYYWENRNKMNVTYIDESLDNERHKLRQSGITRKAMGLTAYYFFNNRRYAQAAAYCFSKYQKRSAGSFLAGISLQHYDVRFDTDQLPEEAMAYVPSPDSAPRILYNDYCVLVGYGYNWVLGRKWLLNVTLTPYIGYRYNMAPQTGEKVSALSLNLRARLGLVYNHKQYFLGIQGYADHHRYKSNSSHLFNSTLDFAALVGIRF